MRQLHQKGNKVEVNRPYLPRGSMRQLSLPHRKGGEVEVRVPDFATNLLPMRQIVKRRKGF